MSGESEDTAKKLPTFTWEEVAKHHTSESLWLVIHDKVYDVTPFMDEHPGGEEVMLEIAGKEATESFEDVGHSPDAREIQAKYLIGAIVTPKSKREKLERKTRLDAKDEATSMSYLGPMLLLLIVAVVLALYLNYS